MRHVEIEYKCYSTMRQIENEMIQNETWRYIKQINTAKIHILIEVIPSLYPDKQTKHDWGDKYTTELMRKLKVHLSWKIHEITVWYWIYIVHIIFLPQCCSKQQAGSVCSTKCIFCFRIFPHRTLFKFTNYFYLLA